MYYTERFRISPSTASYDYCSRYALIADEDVRAPRKIRQGGCVASEKKSQANSLRYELLLVTQGVHCILAGGAQSRIQRAD